VRTDPKRRRFKDLILVLPFKFHRGREDRVRNHSEDDISFFYIFTEFHVPREAEIELGIDEGLYGFRLDYDVDFQHLDSGGGERMDSSED